VHAVFDGRSASARASSAGDGFEGERMGYGGCNQEPSAGAGRGHGLNDERPRPLSHAPRPAHPPGRPAHAARRTRPAHSHQKI
jgi:hypothetical protein